MKPSLIAGLILTAVASHPAYAQEPTRTIDLSSAEYRASPRFPGIETAVLFGERSQTGLYATHARVSAGARIPPHTHPNPLTTWVTSGTAYVGTGRTFDEAKLKAYPAGSYFVTPAGSPHFIAAMDGAFSVLDHGSGPSGFALASASTEPTEPAPLEKRVFSELKHTDIPAFPGVSNTFIVGAFDRPGLYAAQGKMSAGTIFPPHSHPDQRLSIVTSGTMYLGQGETYDETKLVAYPVGTMAITPANTPHFMAAKDGDVTVLEIGSGPSGATFY